MWEQIGMLIFQKFINETTPIFRIEKCSLDALRDVNNNKKVTIFRKSIVFGGDELVFGKGTIDKVIWDSRFSAEIQIHLKLKHPIELNGRYYFRSSPNEEGRSSSSDSSSYRSRSSENEDEERLSTKSDYEAANGDAGGLDDSDEEATSSSNREKDSGDDESDDNDMLRFRDDIDDIGPDPSLQFRYEMSKEQWCSVRRALNQYCKLLLIQGAPGTGKTLVLANIICEMLAQKQSLIVITKTDVGLKTIFDEVVRRRQEIGMNITEYDIMNIDVCSEAEKRSPLFEEYSKNDNIWRSFRYGDKRRNAFADKMSEILEKMRRKIMKNTLVLFTSLMTDFIDSKKFMKQKPRTVIIDDGHVMSKAEIQERIRGVRRMIITSAKIYRSGHKREYSRDSLLRCVTEEEMKPFSHKLKTQYRSNHLIAKWPSECFYRKVLETHSSVADISLRNLPTISEEQKAMLQMPMFKPLVFVDTRTLNLSDMDVERESTNKDLVFYHIKNLLDRGIQCNNIAVVTQNREENDRILKEVKERFSLTHYKNVAIDVNTITEFQGRHKQAVIFSMVQKDIPRKGIGEFEYHLKIAMMGAERQFVLIGNLLSRSRESENLDLLIEIFNEEGEIVTAAEVEKEALKYGPLTRSVSQI